MLYAVDMIALRPLAGDYLDNRHPNEGEQFRTDNVTAQELERHGLACRHYTPPPMPLPKIKFPAFKLPAPPPAIPTPPVAPSPVEVAAPTPPPPEEKVWTPPALAGKMLHSPENKMIRVDGNKVLPLNPPWKVTPPEPVKKRGRGRPPGAKNKPKR